MTRLVKQLGECADALSVAPEDLDSWEHEAIVTEAKMRSKVLIDEYNAMRTAGRPQVSPDEFANVHMCKECFKVFKKES